jgi:hypothetical protein
MKTSSAKSKGRRLQQWVEKYIAKITGLECGKDCPIESRPMGQTGPDIRLDKQAREMFPFTVECKNTESWSLPSTIKQCKANLYPDTQWLVVLGKNRHKPVVVLDAETFFYLLEQLYDKAPGHKELPEAQRTGD